MKTYLLLTVSGRGMKVVLWMVTLLASATVAHPRAQTESWEGLIHGGEHGWVNLRDYNVLPANAGEVNRANLQRAIDEASSMGGVLFLEPAAEGYDIASGVILKQNVSLIGGSPVSPRGSKHPDREAPVGSLIKITDDAHPFLAVQSGTAISNIQFWYPDQSFDDPVSIITYPPTITLANDQRVEGVTLSSLTFYGEYETMNFRATREQHCELLLIRDCYGYPLSGKFIAIDYCYDIPRILDCHVNPAIMRRFGRTYGKAMVDAVIRNGTYAYVIDHTDNAQLMDVFCFGTYGGILLGEESYGQLTNFNFDCVTLGIHKKGANTFNRNWMVAQGSIIANTGGHVTDIHPILVEGSGHLSISNVEAFSGHNPALTTVGKSYDYMTVRNAKNLTVAISGARMANYTADHPLTIESLEGVTIVVSTSFDKHNQLVSGIQRQRNQFKK